MTALGGMASLLFFENRKKCPDIGEKNTLILSIFELNFLLRVKFEFLAENTPNFFLKEPLSFFLFFLENNYPSPLIPQNLPYREKFLVTRLSLI